MCVAIYRPAGKPFDKEILRRSFQGNNHAFGFAYAKDNGIMLYRDPDPKSFHSIWEVLERAANGDAADCPMLVHFRWATHGAKNLANTHPIITHHGQNAVIHNGVINSTPTNNNDTRSDTALFCEQLLNNLPAQLHEHPEVHRYIERLVGSSKLAILHATGAITLINPTYGQWYKELWYSNTNPLPTVTYSGNTSRSTPKTEPIPFRGHGTAAALKPVSFKLFASFSSERTANAPPTLVDAFVSEFGALYVRTRNRRNGGGFYLGDDVAGCRQCDACNDQPAKTYKDMPTRCFQRLCIGCLDDWQFIREIIDMNDRDTTSVSADGGTKLRPKTRKRLRKALTHEQLRQLFDDEDRAAAAKETTAQPNTKQLPISTPPDASPTIPVAEAPPFDDSVIALLDDTAELAIAEIPVVATSTAEN